VSRARCGAQRFAKRCIATGDPGFLESQATGTLALQRTVPQLLHAALRPGHETVIAVGLTRQSIIFQREMTK